MRVEKFHGHIMNITRSPGQDLIPDSVLIHILANSVCGQVQSNADRAMTSNKSLSFRISENVHCDE